MPHAIAAVDMIIVSIAEKQIVEIAADQVLDRNQSVYHLTP